MEFFFCFSEIAGNPSNPIQRRELGIPQVVVVVVVVVVVMVVMVVIVVIVVIVVAVVDELTMNNVSAANRQQQ
jgi:hypothetical protein